MSKNAADESQSRTSRMIRCTLGLLLLILLCTSKPTPASSAALSAEVGLDEPTRALIAALPEVIRNQIIKALREGQPIIDKSVLLYLLRVDEVIKTSIVAARCSATGLAKETTDSTRAFLHALNPFGSSGGGELRPVRDLYDDAIATRAKVGWGTSARDISIAYADLLYRIGRTACQIRDIAVVGVQPVDSLDANVIPKALVWMSLADVCGGPTDCYQKRLGVVRTALQAADTRDVGSVKADERISHLPSETDEPGMFGRLTTRLNLDEYERRLIELATVERGILAAQAVREGNARDAMTSAGLLVDGDESNLRQANFNVSQPRNVDLLNQAVNLGNIIISDRQKVVDQIKSATDLSKSLADEGNRVLARYNNVAAAVPDLQHRAISRRDETPPQRRGPPDPPPYRNNRD